MWVVSLSRPWPWAVMVAGKRIENRWRKDGKVPDICRHRGPLYLHAAKSWDAKAVAWMVERGLCRGSECPPRADHPAGVIFARCRTVGRLAPDGMLRVMGEDGTRYPEDEAVDMRWWMGGHALVWTDVEPTPLVACRGQLGLWPPPADVLAQLGEAT